MTVLGLQWYCAFACLLCQSPCSPSLQVHSYISNHQYGFPISLGFPFFHIFPNAHFSRGMCFFLGGGGGGTCATLFPGLPFPYFQTPFFPQPNPTHHFLELHGCVFWGGGACMRLFLVFPCPHFPFQPIFPNAPFSRGEVPVCLWGVGYCTFILIFLWSCYVSWGGVCTVITIFLNSRSCVCWGGGAHLYQTFTWMCSNVGPQHDMPNQTSDFRLYTRS